MEKAEETLTNKKTQRDDMQAQKVTQTTTICTVSSYNDIHNGNRTEWSPIRSVNFILINLT